MIGDQRIHNRFSRVTCSSFLSSNSSFLPVLVSPGVLRRYSDFVLLHRDLCFEFPQMVSKLPTLPGKKLLGSSMEVEFVATRRTGLEAYMLKLLSEISFVNSKAITQFFIQTRELAGVQVKLGQTSQSGSGTNTRTSSSASSTIVDHGFDAAGLSARMSSIASHLVSLEQKITWASAGAGQSMALEHEMKVIANTLEQLKKKVGVLELAQPYLQHMAQLNTTSQNHLTTGGQQQASSALVGSSKAVNPLVASAGMNGNARPFQSGNRSISGPVGSLRYDWSMEDYQQHDNDEDEEETEGTHTTRTHTKKTQQRACTQDN